MMRTLLCPDGRQIPLVFTVNRVCMLEEKTGRPLHAWLKTDAGALRALLWCVMPENDPDKSVRPGLSMERCGRLLDGCMRAGQTLGDLGALFAAALQDCGFFAPQAKAG